MAGSDLAVRLRLRTDEIITQPGGLPIQSDHEDVIAAIPAVFPLIPPSVSVEHRRFVGHAHVLQGDRLCVYLDPEQEWHPAHGVVGFLNQLWSWLEGAAGGRFDARTALFHPVGGVLHATAGTPTVVVRDPLDLGRRAMGLRWLHRRTPARLDLMRVRRAADDLAAVVVAVPAPLRYGAGSTVGAICSNFDHIGQSRDAFLHALAMTGARNPPGAPIYFVLGVPHGAAAHDQQINYLICGRIGGHAADQLRTAAKEQGALIRLPLSIDLDATPVDWCRVSEERQAMTTRRDHQLPVNAFKDADAVVWGCGGLGSWAAEFVVRSGASRIRLCDPTHVTGALLVRQNYTEGDIGTTKAEALARRLSDVSDTVAIEIIHTPFALLADGQLPECDVLIDATVNNAVAFGVGAIWATTTTRPLVARISTDRTSSTLGLLTIVRPGTDPTPEQADLLTRQHVMSEPELEPFRCFWDPPGTRRRGESRSGLFRPHLPWIGGVQGVERVLGDVVEEQPGLLGGPHHDLAGNLAGGCPAGDGGRGPDPRFGACAAGQFDVAGGVVGDQSAGDGVVERFTQDPADALLGGRGDDALSFHAVDGLGVAAVAGLGDECVAGVDGGEQLVEVRDAQPVDAQVPDGRVEVAADVGLVEAVGVAAQRFAPGEPTGQPPADRGQVAERDATGQAATHLLGLRQSAAIADRGVDGRHDLSDGFGVVAIGRASSARISSSIVSAACS